MALRLPGLRKTGSEAGFCVFVGRVRRSRHPANATISQHDPYSVFLRYGYGFSRPPTGTLAPVRPDR
ncbi:hypothetical protein AOX65_05295 [Enterobacter hormaechei]|nr:hypothetical protein AOX65_05295 [Enterobacter hormaechei]